MKTKQSRKAKRGSGSLYRLVRAVGDIFLGTCSEKKCRNRPYVFGVCKKHVAAEFERAGKKVDAEEKRKLVDAMTAALRTVESERGNSPNVLMSDGPK